MEYGSRLAEDQKKLSTRFAAVADLIREANFYAIEEKSPYITASQIMKAIEEKIYRSNLIEEKIQEFIERGIYLIDTERKRSGRSTGYRYGDWGISRLASRPVSPQVLP